MKRYLSLILALSFLSTPLSAFADEATLFPAETTTEVIVSLSTTSDSALVAVEETPGITITQILSDTTVLVEAHSSTNEAIRTLEDLPFVSFAEPNLERPAFALGTNDTYSDLLWSLENTGQAVRGVTGTAGADIHALSAWNLSLGTSSVVAVIDSGVLYTHPDLAANMWDGTNCVSDTGAALGSCIHGYDFADSDTDPAPIAASSTYEHGTHVSGTIAALKNNGIGGIGAAPSSVVMALRFDFDTASEIRAIDFARLNGAKIINASYGGTQFSQAEYDAIKRFTDAGGIFVAAAGNGSSDNDTSPIYPAAYDLPGIISVAATDQYDSLASFSNYGSTTVDISAPGTNIVSTYVVGTSTSAYAYADGTSMSAPHVAAVVALIKSAFPLLSATSTKEAILSGGDTVSALTGKTLTGKRLNAYGSLLAASSTDLTPPLITLTGSSTLSLLIGDVYTELGATAYDTHDGTTTVVVGGDTATTSTAATYHITYDSVDAAGNRANQVIRTVIVSAPIIPPTPAPAPSGGGSSGGSGGGGGGSSSNAPAPKITPTIPAPVSPNVGRPALKPIPAAPLGYSVVSAPVINTYRFTHTLALGSKGAEVTALQKALTHAGIYKGPITAYFGPLTRAAVRAFQTKNGLSPVGYTGPKTRVLLSAIP